jgi:hypothetical protein
MQDKQNRLIDSILKISQRNKLIRSITPLEVKSIEATAESGGQARTILMPDRWSPNGWSYKTREDIESQRNFVKKVENITGIYSKRYEVSPTRRSKSHIKKLNEDLSHDGLLLS